MSKINLTQANCETAFTFDNFIVKNTNRFAHAAALVVAENKSTVYNPLVIYGPSGVGKTHLSRAIDNKIRQKYPHKIIEFVHGDDLGNQIVKSLNDELDIDEVKAKCCNADILIIDDLHLIADKKVVQIEVFNIINDFYQNNKPIIVTLDRKIRETKLSDKIKSCLLNGLIADIVPDDFEINE